MAELRLQQPTNEMLPLDGNQWIFPTSANLRWQIVLHMLLSLPSTAIPGISMVPFSGSWGGGGRWGGRVIYQLATEGCSEAGVGLKVCENSLGPYTIMYVSFFSFCSLFHFSVHVEL